MQQRRSQLLSELKHLAEKQAPFQAVASGQLVRVVGLTLEASGCRAPVGSLCAIDTMAGKLIAEVIGFDDELLYLMPVEELRGVLPGAKVMPLGEQTGLSVGLSLLGRVLDGNGQPLDGRGALHTDEQASRHSPAINPLARRAITEPLDVGVRAINAMLTVGKGQRMGLFAGSGVGKSVLLGMMTRGTTADIIVVGLVGERGREVKEFIEEILGAEGRARSVVIAAPADTSPLMRLRACETSTRIAEYFRDLGYDVLLLMDSLTRYAQAQREIALAVGEPPATKGYPPSVFAKLPRLVERAGNGGEGQGSITAFYTVLTEGDDQQDPIADASRAILDGHIVLSRALADSGHYPAIDIEASISRVAPMVISEAHLEAMRRVKQVYSLYQQNRDLISIGAYSQGSDPRIDNAIRLQPAMNAFLRQGMRDAISFSDCQQMLGQLAAQCKV
ncbi:flagellar protein export ATPase FliI [Shewanella algae]|uniref:flagellar protein export ATPase FliI n=1 Tax=Shewanella algae TaxID=38313 RepID=UPI000BB5D2C0|nr:flagellar protein export ATPase FliI [Shewanella algae]PBQ29033.1 EscN/YscN/HrcN family type III secretion system ATPase [Shewanella algae]QNI01192.1 flagellar protein export ATPase FliI [Shewanella algae]QTE84606.1 flagellar protein export ATPase FliI [Shewanella algae]TVO87713.1 EscN/YscN/HrcN family type III secretion system ATPase [Shewanella algae]TXS85042.1 EscN/YscN/HrcN family type III secretion system ATPase [Shewanella algae]